MMEKKITRIRSEFDDESRSAAGKYQSLFVGSYGWLDLVKYELMQFLLKKLDIRSEDQMSLGYRELLLKSK